MVLTRHVGAGHADAREDIAVGWPAAKLGVFFQPGTIPGALPYVL
jgi:hypothetical protein